MPARSEPLSTRRPRAGRPAVCCAVAVAIGLLALAWRQPPATALESAESDDEQLEQSDPVRSTGHDYHLFNVKGFDEDSLQRRERIDAADQDANAALQWANAQRLRRESAGSETRKSKEEDKTAPKGSGRANPERNWITPFRASEAASHFRAVAPKGVEGEGGGGGGWGGGGGEGGGGGGQGAWMGGPSVTVDTGNPEPHNNPESMQGREDSIARSPKPCPLN
jgi:hypothetical protein